jgi:hypothetical protein
MHDFSSERGVTMHGASTDKNPPLEFQTKSATGHRNTQLPLAVPQDAHLMFRSQTVWQRARDLRHQWHGGLNNDRYPTGSHNDKKCCALRGTNMESSEVRSTVLSIQLVQFSSCHTPYAQRHNRLSAPCRVRAAGPRTMPNVPVSLLT